MDNKSDVFTALNTKLIKLQKAIEYLSFHFEEHCFQVQELQNRYEKEEDKIIRDTQIEIDSIKYNIKQRNPDIEKQMNEDFINQTNKLKTELFKIKQKIIEDTNNALAKVTRDLTHQKGKVKHIGHEMKKEIEFLSKTTNIDPENVQEKLLQLIENHNKTLEAHDSESERKQKLLENQLLKVQNDLENKYMNIINDLRRKLRPPPQIRSKILSSLQNCKQELFELHNELNKIRSTAKKIAHTKFSQNLNKIRVISDEIKTENEDFQQKNAHLQTLLQETILQIQVERRILMNQMHEQKIKFNSELDQLNEELRSASNPVLIIEKRNKLNETKIENRIQNIQKKINEIKDLNSLHEKEKNEINAFFEKEIQEENDRFEEKKKKLKAQIDLKKKIDEKTKEKEELLKYKQTLIISPIISYPQVSIKTEINEVETLLNKEYKKAQIEKKSTISNYFSECDNQINQIKEDTKNEYERRVALIVNDYKNNDVIKRVSQSYEELLKSLESHNDTIELPEKKENENVEISKDKEFEEKLKNLRNFKIELKKRINEEKTEIIEKFELLIDNENERFQSSRFFEGDVIYDDFIIYEENQNKKALAPLKLRIVELEKEFNELTQKTKLVDNLNTVKNDSQYQIKRALQQKADESLNLISEISNCSKHYSNLIHEETEANAAYHPVIFESNISKLKQDIENVKKKLKSEEEKEKRRFNRKFQSLQSSFQNEKNEKKKEISYLKRTINENKKQFDIDIEHSQSNYNKIIAETESKYLSEFTANKINVSFVDYDNKISILKRERDRNMKLYNDSSGLNAKMREQEREKIDELEIQLFDKSKELAQLGKDLVIAREISIRNEKNNEKSDDNNKGEPIVSIPRRDAVTPLNATSKSKRRIISSSVEIKRPNMSRTTGRLFK